MKNLEDIPVNFTKDQQKIISLIEKYGTLQKVFSAHDKKVLSQDSQQVVGAIKHIRHLLPELDYAVKKSLKSSMSDTEAQSTMQSLKKISGQFFSSVKSLFVEVPVAIPTIGKWVLGILFTAAAVLAIHTKYTLNQIEKMKAEQALNFSIIQRNKTRQTWSYYVSSLKELLQPALLAAAGAQGCALFGSPMATAACGTIGAAIGQIINNRNEKW